MPNDVKSAFADILIQEQVEYVFGHTGGHIMHMWEAANESGIQLILNKQEGNAVYMADAYTRITKKVSVILATAGPGATNMLTGLATSFMDSIPLVAIAAGVPTRSAGRNAMQDGSGRGRAINQRLAFEAVCKQAMLVQTPQEAPNVLREAFRIAMSGRPGPVYVEVPSDFWNLEISYQGVSPLQYKNVSLPACHPHDTSQIIDALQAARSPLIVIGEGAEEAGIGALLSGFIERVQIPFTVSPVAKDYIDEFHPLYLGAGRFVGKNQKVFEYMRQSDFILYLGNRMQEWGTNFYDATLVEQASLAQVDPDPNEIGRVFPVEFSAVGSISSFITSAQHKPHDNAANLLARVNDLAEQFPRQKRYPDGQAGLNPYNLNNVIEELAAVDANIVCDSGYAKSMAIVKFRTRASQRFIVADANGPMGYAVPAALGAALANQKETICFVGDGSFQMSLNELGTLLNYPLKVIFIIQSNGGCASIAEFHTKTFGHHCATEFTNPDFSAIAKAYGMQTSRVSQLDELEQAFLKAQKADRSTIIDVQLEQQLMQWE